MIPSNSDGSSSSNPNSASQDVDTSQILTKERKKEIKETLNSFFEDRVFARINNFEQKNVKANQITVGGTYVKNTDPDGLPFMIKFTSKEGKNASSANVDLVRMNFVNEFITAPFYKRTLYDRTPIIEGVESDFEPMLAFRSKFLHDFQMVSQFTKGKEEAVVGDDNNEELKKTKGIAKVFASMLAWGESDAHAGNIGVMKMEGDELVLAKIDHGFSATQFFTNPDIALENFSEMYCMHHYDKKMPINIDDFKTAIDEIANVSDEEIENIVKSRVQKLKKLGFDIKNFKLYFWEDNRERRFNVDYPYTIETFDDFEKLEEHYISHYKKQKALTRKISDRLNEEIEAKKAELVNNDDITGGSLEVWEKEGCLPAINKFTPLMLAITHGDTNEVKKLLDEESDPNVRDKHSKTALIYAVKYFTLEILQMLLDKRADFNVPDNNGKNAIMYAAEIGFYKAVEILLERGATVDAETNDGKTALMYAAQGRHEGGNGRIVNRLLSKGADFNKSDHSGKTVLMYAIQGGNYNIVQQLLEKGVDVNKRDNSGKSALMYAIEKGGYYFASLLLEYGADPGDLQGRDKLFVFGCAIENEQDNAAKAVLEVIKSNESLNESCDVYGNTALMKAISSEKTDFVKILLDKGADVNVQKDGASALSYAVAKGNMETIKMLLDRGANTNVKCVGLYSPSSILASEVCQGHPDIVKILLEYGADPNTSFEDSYSEKYYTDKNLPIDKITPLMAAVLSGGRGFENAIMLLEKGASTFVKDKDGKEVDLTYAIASARGLTYIKSDEVTMLMYAAKRGHIDAVKTLSVTSAAAALNF